MRRLITRQRPLALAAALTGSLALTTGAVALFSAPAMAAGPINTVCSNPVVHGVTLTDCLVEPSSTSSTGAITQETNQNYWHRLVAPSTGTRKARLVVFLGGSSSSPSGYDTITQEAASKGFGVVNLRYPNASEVGTLCGDNDSCFTQYRGSDIFGPGISSIPGVTTTGPAAPPYANTANITVPNSVVYRLVSVLDSYAATSGNGWWGQFLTANSSSPYKTDQHPGGVVPNWSLIDFSGHSQGGGHATFIGTTVPTAHSVISFSAPTDSYTDQNGATRTVTWVSAATGTGRFWGLRDTREGAYGACTSYNWHNLGLAAPASCTSGDEAAHSWESFVGTGAGAPNGKHFLVTTDRPNDVALYAHDSTAADNNAIDGSAVWPFSTDRVTAWDYLFASAG